MNNSYPVELKNTIYNLFKDEDDISNGKYFPFQLKFECFGKIFHEYFVGGNFLPEGKEMFRIMNLVDDFDLFLEFILDGGGLLESIFDLFVG